ncbi:D-beta-hydroxybutyrate dehydrogenase, mitochondrial-like [Hyalella azteca]|uniref:D-beta-hydroxybutyrate dehydrogenase, mitochondrial-like n=1 Tax=Hyalella azteca TaxID=294128 RepID=A0A8B7NDM6_HYAAZ|nr:D-beta-hydroxybutyrate dehydrogenase, mitochondrial-like [Hyalella azteca]
MSDDKESPEQEHAEDSVESLQQPLLTLDRIFMLLLFALLSMLLDWVLDLVDVDNSELLGIVIWIAAAGVFLGMSSKRLPAAGKAVLITGCDSGIGLQLAQYLHKGGLRVFALCLMDGEGAKTLRALKSDRLHVILGDVTKPEELKKARTTVQELLPEGEGLWGVVNNAGIAAFGDVEWLPLSTYRKIYEVNVVGTIAATQAFLPLVRRAKGRIVNVASMLGRMGVPMRSPYVASKFAVEGLSDCLSCSGTNIFTEESVQKSADEMWANMSEEVKSDYGEELLELILSTDLTPVLQAFAGALLDAVPQARYQPMDLYYKTRVFVASHCPEWLYDNIYVGCLNK